MSFRSPQIYHATWLPNFSDPRGVINLAPAELPKQAASFDLPITLGMLAGSGQLVSEKFRGYAGVGELVLDGNARARRGALNRKSLYAR